MNFKFIEGILLNSTTFDPLDIKQETLFNSRIFECSFFTDKSLCAKPFKNRKFSRGMSMPPNGWPCSDPFPLPFFNFDLEEMKKLIQEVEEGKVISFPTGLTGDERRNYMRQHYPEIFKTSNEDI